MRTPPSQSLPGIATALFCALYLLFTGAAWGLVEGYVPTPAIYVIYTFCGCGLLFLAIITVILKAYRWLHYTLLAAALVLTKAAVSGALPYWLGGSDFAMWVVPYLVISGTTVIGYWVAGAQLEAPHPLIRYRKLMYGTAIVSAIGPLTSYFWLMVIPLNLMWLPQLVLFYSMYLALMVTPWSWSTDSKAEAIIVRAYPIVGGLPFVLLPFFEESGYGLVGETAQTLELTGILVQFVYIWFLAIWLGVSAQNARRAAERAALEASKNEAELQLALVGAERDYQDALSVAQASRQRLATVSHDLKQPLASLRAAVDRFAQSTELDDAGALNRAVDYVEGLARAYGADSNEHYRQQSLHDAEAKDTLHHANESLDIDLLFDSLKQMFTQQAQAHSVELELRSKNAVVSVPPLDAMRVLSNLIANALAHANASVVVVEQIEGTACAEISVTDNGDGMTPEALRELRASGAKGDKSDGDGLGLAIVEELCRAHGWCLRMESDLQAGTQARLQFPLASA